MQAHTDLTPAARPRQLTERDARGCTISGAAGPARDGFERALAAALSWRGGADALLAETLAQAPGFVMAHVLQAWLLLCGRDPARARAAAPVLARAAALPANERERLHLAAIGAALDDNFECTRALLGELLRLYPRDAVALQVAHALDYVSGDLARMGDRVAAVLPAWSDQLPGYHAVLAMHAFSLEECGEFERAEEAAGAALALEPADARAHHVMAHLFEMTGRLEAGMRWMGRHAERWSAGTVVATHCWWHVALFHLAQGRLDGALAIYDKRIRAGRDSALADLIDAASLLWRVELRGGDGGARWADLAAAWEPHIEDAYCSFNDLHAMLAFVGARDWERAQRLERSLAASQSQPTRHGATTALLGLPACRALMAYGRGDDSLALTLLASLPALAHRFGGSHAQRDVLHLTMLETIEHLRRPARRRLAQAA